MSRLETLGIGKLHQEGRRIVLIIVVGIRQMQKHEVKTWLSICGINLRGYADGLVKVPRKSRESRK